VASDMHTQTPVGGESGLMMRAGKRKTVKARRGRVMCVLAATALHAGAGGPGFLGVGAACDGRPTASNEDVAS
jgi:hypothetical protein